MSRIVVLGALPRSLLNFRGDLLKALVLSGHEVVAMAAQEEPEVTSALAAWGVRFHAYPVQRNGLNPCRDLQTFWVLRTMLTALAPDIVLAYTVKPIVWGSIAMTGMPSVQFFALIEGVGYAFQPGNLKRKLLTQVVTGLYRLALKKAQKVLFLNQDNKQLFLRLRIVQPYQVAIINGTGIDLDRFSVAPFPAGDFAFLTIARLLGEKGLREYAEAACLVKVHYPGVVFRLLGGEDPSPDGIPLQEVQGWHTAGVVEYLGTREDVRPVIADCHIYVLPSYHEGMPRTVLEALAMGRPILTTDVPGCRETILFGENGFLVPKAEAEALAERMIWFIEHPDQWERMGQRSRRLAEERFDVHRVNKQLMHEMGLMKEAE